MNKLSHSFRLWFYDVAFLLILAVAAYFRLSGLNWDQNAHLHPDERFMTMVESAVQPVKSLSDFFNTSTSTLNPYNRGFGFYVYGDLPVFIVRYAAAWLNGISDWAARAGMGGGAGAWDWAGYDQVALVGRAFSALSDLGSIILLYMIAKRLYGRKVALLSAAFSSLVVMQIQQSHFFTVDMFANFFMILATYFAVEVMLGNAPAEMVILPQVHGPEAEPDLSLSTEARLMKRLKSGLRDPLVWNTVGFGLALGAAVASKINAAPLAVLLPGALFVRYFRLRKMVQCEPAAQEADRTLENALPEIIEEKAGEVEESVPAAVIPSEVVTSGVEPEAQIIEEQSLQTQGAEEKIDAKIENPAPRVKTNGLSLEMIASLLVLGAVVSALAFRVFMPYAFSGPGFFGVSPNPKWMDNIAEQRAQAGGDVDFPPALQWARRSFLFSGYNLVAWGLGWPLGILTILAFVYMGWRILRGEWREHILLWGWAGAYFVWQSIQWNPTMRYQLPIYPLLALFAAWFIFNGPRSFPGINAWFASRLHGNPEVGSAQERNDPASTPRQAKLPVFGSFFSLAYFLLAAVVLMGTFAWAYAFTRIYTRDHSRVQASNWIYQNVPGPYNLKIQQPDGSIYTQPMSLPVGNPQPGAKQGFVISQLVPYDAQFNANASGSLTGITLAHAVNAGSPGSITLSVMITDSPDLANSQPLGKANLVSEFNAVPDARGGPYTLSFDKPIALEKEHTYYLRLSTTGMLSLIGSAPAQETSWDDGLPLRMNGYDAFGGIYQGDLNLEMYFDDNKDKLTRFESTLNAADYVFISSDRQWATTTRLPERYPLTTAYYRNLLGCPDDKEITWCYNVATPGMFSGKLGFELVQTFTSYPELFGSQPAGYIFNTQFAEEAFTVYDAPKVLIFKKTNAYNQNTVQSLLEAVDLTHVVHVLPRDAGRVPNVPGSSDLMLPATRLAVDRAGGTWNGYFSYENFQNKYPVVGLLIWYLAIGFLGLFTWPLLRFLLPGLSDKGYPLSKLSGMLLLAYLVWLTASLGGQYSRLTIASGYGVIVLAGAAAFYFQRAAIREEIRVRGKYFLLVEGIFLAFFLIDLSIRLGNPDLWHPARGGERPMDFSYLNAVLKSTSFPPYDPWYAGGYINYYYWGFVLVGTPIKLLGIVPSIAYNFVLPTLFAMLGMGGFSVAWNLMESTHKFGVDGFKPKESAEMVIPDLPGRAFAPFSLPLIAGLAAGAGLVLMGNLGTVQLLYHALQKMAVTSDLVDSQNVLIIQRLAWAAEGLGKLISGATLPIGWGEYYWAPSRVMPLGDLAITEFPLFTFIYSDLHAHMLALPLTLLSISWALSTLLARKLSRWNWLATLAFGGLVIGALRPTNTWDFPTYLALGVIVTGYAIFRYADLDDRPRFGLAPFIQRAFLAIAGMGLLVGAALLLFQPFAQWYGLAYSQVSQWTNEKTPIWSYWTQWGLFQFVIVTWMVWETRQWLAQTPLSALAKLKPYELLLEVGAAACIGIWLALQFILNVPIAWFAFPLAVWALILIFRPGQPDVKRLVLFMTGTGLVLTLIVEFIVLSGDIGRMNTVFKFYLQVWVLFAVSAAAALGWILSEWDEWGPRSRIFFETGGSLLLVGALLYTFTASMDKIRDRIAPNIPFTFDSVTYMQYSTYFDQVQLDLNRDYKAIRWMQDNVKGSPVIVEANTPEYRWGTRYTIYTGLPGVAGWSWHQRQQRALFPGDWVTARIQEITDFYNTSDLQAAKNFLTKYSVKFIVVGQLEQTLYNKEGLAKFESANGRLWKVVYQDSGTFIYEVLP